jgi:hypothetical protein
MEKYSPNWLLDKLNNSKTDAHKLMHIIDFQNNVGLHDVRYWNASRDSTTEAGELSSG